MAGLGAVISYRDAPPTRELSRLLSVMDLRGGDGYGVSDGAETFYFKEAPKPEDVPLQKPLLIGYTYKECILQDFEQPVNAGDFTLAGDGEIYSEESIEPVSSMIIHSKRRPHLSLINLLKNMDGVYAVVLYWRGSIYALRDPLGVKPLYYGRGHGFIALASERKALWALGIKHPVSFPPGSLGRFSRSIAIRRRSHLFYGKPTSRGVDESVNAVALMLEESVKRRLMDVHSVAIAFSGGLDSSLIALLTRRLGLRVELYSAMVEDAPEIEQAEEAARLLDLPIQLEVIGTDTLLRHLDRIIWFIEEPDRMRFEVATPLYYAALRAHMGGYGVILSGQGSDELFGGYRRFQSTLKEKGWNGLGTAIVEALKNSYRINFERDEPVITGIGLAGRFPYADRGLINFGLKLSPKLKIYGEDDDLRKRILRKAALKLGLPKDLAFKKKKSAQYGSGVHHAFMEIAKKRNLTPRNLLLEAYRGLLEKAKKKALLEF
ncbi:MAG: asparagine synthetase B [Candidatus Bathyarchaeia archaeon]